MTEQQTVTCRSVCERLLAWNGIDTRAEPYLDLLRDARLALGQPDGDADELRRKLLAGQEAMEVEQKHYADLQAQYDELRADVRSLTQQLDESKRLASEWQKRAEEAELRCAALAGQRDGCDEELSRVRFLADWLLDRLVERSAV